MDFLIYLNPLSFLFGALTLFLTPFGWAFLAFSAALYYLACSKKTSDHGEWTLGLFLVAFWLSHLVSERSPTTPTYPCGRTQGVTEGVCEVYSTAGFPFPSLHYFPAGDEPYLGMWPLFFFNAFLFAIVSWLIVRRLPKEILEMKLAMRTLLVLGVLITLIGEVVILLRFD